ncbi:hypothetical protein M2T28_14295 [Elizabethkingia miricola]|uniref:hypothetical protein n=1 Tax=Elizabethkingia miricola TaxID=172045 RepID=UPI00201952A3|nr:hypothetical protein [Elizabethkingia miricola]MCL1653791.1 hypothetical protein [Elizabethkingia miricola]
MAGQGTFIAYQPLRPTELKVGDLVSQSINYMIQRGEAQKAAKLKMQQEQGKNLYDIYKDIKLDPLQTVAPFQNAYNDFVGQGIDMVSKAKSRALDYSIPYEQRVAELQKAQKFSNDVKMLGTFMTSKDDQEAFRKNVERLNSGDYFEGDNRVGLMQSLATSNAQLIRDKDGDIAVAFAGSPDSKMGDQAVIMKLSEAKNLLTSGLENNLLDGDKGLITSLNKSGKDMVVQQERNTNGVTTYKTIKFDRDRAVNYLKSSIGYSSPEDFNINSVPQNFNQLFFRTNKRNIENSSDLVTAINLAANIMESGAKEVDSVKQSKTDNQLALEALRLQNAGLQIQERMMRIANGGSRGGNNGGSGANVSIMPSNTSSIVQVQDNDGNVIGTRRQNMSTTTLPKVKGMPASNNTFGLSTYVNKKGNQVNAWYLGAPSDDGKSVYSRISETEFNNYVRGLGYNPISVKATLTNSDRELIKQPSGINKNNSIYKNTKISFKSKDLGDDIDL